MTATRKWSALAVLLVAAIFVASWFLLIAPKRSDAAALRSQKVEQDATNQRLRQQLELLKAQALELPKQQAFLAQIRRQLPDNPALPALIRDLTGAAKKSGVDLVSLAPSLPVAVVSSTPVAAPVASPAPGSTEDAPAVPAPAAPPVTLYQVSLNVKTSGSYFEMEQFLNKIEGLKRSFLVTGFTLKEVAASGTAASGTTAGELELDLQGRVFLSPQAAAAVRAPVPSTAPSTAPPAN